MKNKKINKKSKIMAVFIGLICLGMTACGNAGEKDPASEAVDQSVISGKIQIAGSTSVQPLSEELAKAFMEKNSGLTIHVAGGGSGAGIKAAENKTADIGASSRELKSEEKSVKEVIIALDGIAVIVHKDNPLEDLPKEDIKKIFLGEMTDWAQVGNMSGPIRVYTREEGSGTRGAFEELILGKDAVGKELKIIETANVQNSTGAVRTAVAGDKNGIGYISIGSLNDEIKAVKVDKISATVENVKAGTYGISRPFIYMTKDEPSGAVKAYIEWVLSAEGQELVAKSFIPIN